MGVEEIAYEYKDKYFPVLDHGFVALKDFMGGDGDICDAARISYGAGTRKIKDNRTLLRYLLRHRHSSPYEMCKLKFHVKLPIFVARQLIRHRMANVNEYSMRYSLAPLQFYVPEFDNFQKQSKTNRQGRTEQADRDVYDRIRNAWSELQSAASETYQDAILEDIARELARIHLPLSLYTEWYWCVDLHNLLHFLGLRADPHAQWEIQKFAQVKAGLAKVVAPLAFEAWIDYRHCATSLSRMEWNILRKLITMQGTVLKGTDYGFATEYPKDSIVPFEESLAVSGIDKRELAELIAKFNSTKEVSIPDYTLNLADAKEPGYFLERAQAAVPERIRGK